MAFVQDEDPVEALGPNRTNEPFCVSVGSWSSPWGANDLHPLGLEDLIEHGTESLVAIMDEESHWGRAGLGQVPSYLSAPTAGSSPHG
jgi:hypothetical protein